VTAQVRRYLPWVRTGAAAAITAADTLGTSPLPGRASVPVTARVNAGAGEVTLRLYGPGDVTGIDQRQVIRADPATGTTNAEPNYFPVVEFDSPELPWLFTPAKATAGNQLRPWICLVVVRAEAAELRTESHRPGPVLRVTDARIELPDLAQSWAWAHAQVNGAGAVDDALHDPDPARALSRLVAPRKLDADTAYIAAVVPAFASGRAAGLGEEVDDTEPGTLAPTWDATTTFLELPTYYAWTFATGPAGDFEALATALGRVQLDQDEVGGRTMVVEDLPAGLPDLGQVVLPGALGAADLPTTSPPQGFATALHALLTAPEPVPAGTPAPAGLAAPPPMYGRWHAGRRPAVAAAGTDWLATLNLDVRYRVAAALGTRAVQEQQEQLMAAAWQQAGQVLEANRLLRQGQMAREAGAAVRDASLAALPPAQLMLVAAPALSRVTDPASPGGDATVAATVAASLVPAGLTSPAFRKAARGRGPLSRRAGGPGDTAQVLRRVNAGEVTVVPPAALPEGAVTMDRVFAGEGERPRLCALTPEFLRSVPAPGDRPGLVPRWEEFRAAALAHQRGMVGCDPPRPTRRPELDLPGLAATVVAALDPAVTVTARLHSRIRRPDGWDRDDPLEPVLAAPTFPAPMYRALADLAPDLLLPGVAKVPPDSLSALPTNPRFIEAFMLGLNHEMGRELLWRGYPTDQRGTCFRQFWDPAGAVPAPVTEQDREARLDIPAITEWAAGTALGSHLRGGEQVLLLIRGELLRRYPRTVIYAARAEWVQEAGTWVRRPVGVTNDPAAPKPSSATFAERYPVFSGTLPPDLTFLGFDLDPDDARGDPERTAGKPGWFLVFQQQPTEIRLGLDETVSPDPTGTWRDLAWPHVATDPAGYVQLAPLPAPPAGPDITDNPQNLTWGTGSTSAQLAAIVEQPPVRIAVHASDLLPEQP
jgi:hypothetical protein